ncbi:MAG: hypothetical protein BAJALOKI1v1_1960007 [Promethearchaeota archaeon]|nr:MAG: hypothetical protein BAJALOKI1v1_1960007 [Candidatus Lokiarchaeota archaeon]
MSEIAILEAGVNLGGRSIFEIKFYTDTTNPLDSDLRAGFLTALESFTSEIFNDDINVVSLASFKMVCYTEIVSLPLPEEKKNSQSLIFYAIIEKETDTEIVKKQLQKISSHFLNRFPLNDIFTKKKRYFNKKFSSRVDEVLGDLKLKTEDRFRSIF